jgi:NAD(P)-dependent dehydrogenase (short-subunit alcohol dehydrogenase family)
MQSDIPTVADLLHFHGKVVVVTGAGRGIGAGVARRFSEAGAAVVVNYRHKERGPREVIEAIERSGGRAMAGRADVSEPAEVIQLFDRVREAFGRLDVLVNNAGAYPVAPIVQMTERDWDFVVDANLKSAFLCTQAAARLLIEQGQGGAIINVASIEGMNPARGHAHYDAAKSGVLMLTRTAALELGSHGIRVNAVSPGLIWREGLDRDWPEGVARYRRAVPLGRLGHPEDVADACLFLASPAARWVSGANLVVDGGVLTNTAY